MKPLVLGLGNELLGDDAIGIEVVRRLRGELGESADVVESSLHGLALIDLMLGYDRMIIIDAITTGRYAVGTVVSLKPNELASVPGPSPHYSGLPEISALAGQLCLDFPSDIRIVAVEIGGGTRLGSIISAKVAAAMGEMTNRIKSIVDGWNAENGRRLGAVTDVNRDDRR